MQHQVPSTAIIGTFDVSSLDTNIPHDVTLMNHVLTKNNFTFLDKHYLQVYCDGHTYGAIYGFGPMLTLDLVALYRQHILHLDQW